MLLWAAAASCAPVTSQTLVSPPRRQVPGRHFELKPAGKLYVPDFFAPEQTTATDVLVFIHGAPWCAEQSFYDARRNAVLVCLGLNDFPGTTGASSRLSEVLEATTATLAREAVSSRPLGKLCVASFSGGYSIVHRLLLEDRLTSKISDLVLADSLYPKRDPGHPDQLLPESIEPVLAYARRAADGHCSFWFSHLFPPEPRYRNNTTTLAADYLISRIGAQRRPCSSRNSRAARLLYRADVGKFHVLGYQGMTTQDHFEHLYGIGELFGQISFAAAGKANTPCLR
jgi:hypothetical protein